jgi:diguanylate cyclase (GGDEF)-like protein
MMRKKIQDILCGNIIATGPEAPVTEAIELMKQHDISCIVVVDGKNNPAGIFTERDIVRCTAMIGTSFVHLPMHEVMSKTVLTANTKLFLYEAFHLFTENEIRHLVVVDNNDSVIGVVTQSDVIQHIGLDYFLNVKPVSRIMTMRLYTVSPDMNLLDASKLMADKRLSFLLVASGDKPLGVLTERDMARLVNAFSDLVTIPVKNIMTSPIITISEGAQTHEAAIVMISHNIRRLIVTSHEGGIAGVITQTDMVKGFENEYIEALRQIISEQSGNLDQAVQELSTKNIYLDSIFSSAINLGFVTCDSDFKILHTNRAAQKILFPNKKFAAWKDRKLQELQFFDRELFSGIVNNVQQLGSYEFCFSLYDEAAGKEKHIEASLNALIDKGHCIGYVLMAQDHTARKKDEDDIRKLAYYDSLTSLPNRALLFERLSLVLARYRRYQCHFALLFIDLDRFKDINDLHGHDVGDKLLVKLASRTRAILRETDTVARLAGDEFVVILAELQDKDDAEHICRKMMDRLSEPYHIFDKVLTVGVSIGIAQCPADGCEADELLKKADQAMYQAKRMGKENKKSNYFIHLRQS